jgi:serine/threonine protein kinase
MVGLLLQYHPAGTLAAMLSCQQFPDYADKTKWLVQATEAVRYIHSKGIIHGDLGSHNFLVQNDGTLALADFGGSRIDGCECLEHPPARYTRPAVISQLGLQPTEKDDLFALGTVLFEISTCQQLYQDKSDSEIRDLFAKQIFPDLAPVAVGVHLVIKKCWKGGYNSAEGVSRDMHLPIHQLMRRTLFGYIGLFSMTLAVVLVTGAIRGNILRIGRPAFQVLFGRGGKV